VFHHQGRSISQQSEGLPPLPKPVINEYTTSSQNMSLQTMAPLAITLVASATSLPFGHQNEPILAMALSLKRTTRVTAVIC